jgi:hypothetical protein
MIFLAYCGRLFCFAPHELSAVERFPMNFRRRIIDLASKMKVNIQVILNHSRAGHSRPPKTSSCTNATNGYLNHMDWQKMAALSVVAVTAVFFLRAKLRRRKFSFEHDTHCGCTAAGADGARTSIIFSARKGGRAKIIMKHN